MFRGIGRVACGDDKGSIWLYEEFLKKTNSKHKQPLYKVKTII